VAECFERANFDGHEIYFAHGAATSEVQKLETSEVAECFERANFDGHEIYFAHGAATSEVWITAQALPSIC
jgi:xanthine dehydrogenase molybdopterin-binding subunit B